MAAAAADNDTAEGGGAGLVLNFIFREHLEVPERLAAICADVRHSYYLSRDWDPHWYASLAYHGFLSVAQHDLLVPELQRAYSVLDWGDHRCGRSVRRRARRSCCTLRLDRDLGGVLAAINSQHRFSWLVPRYTDMLCRMHREGTWRCPGGGQLRVVSVEVLDAQGSLVAGEVGYCIGATYTSLTGFAKRPERSCASSAAVAGHGRGPPAAASGSSPRRHRRRTGPTSADEAADAAGSPAAAGAPQSAGGGCPDGVGALQLHALGRLLARCGGVRFWNLGHPPSPQVPSMAYKADLGAHVLSRADFLVRWRQARDEALPAPLLGLRPEGEPVAGLIDPGARPHQAPPYPGAPEQRGGAAPGPRAPAAVGPRTEDPARAC